MSGAAPPNCLWCEGDLSGGAVLAGRLRCPYCGAQTTSPRPSDSELVDAYEGWYRPPEGRFTGPGDAVLGKLRSQLARRLNRVAPPGPVLDVGAGDGSLVRAIAATGREAVGIDRTATAPGVRPLALEEVGGEWAAVVFWHALEHLPRPGRALSHAAGLLAPGGVLVVAAPNADSIQARLFGDRWFALDLPRHLVHLPARTLLSGISGAGLRVERVSHVRGGQVLFGWLHGLVGLLPGRPDLYDAIRREEARRGSLPARGRAAALAAACVLAPLAVVGAAVEVAVRRGGTVYVEARRA